MILFSLRITAAELEIDYGVEGCKDPQLLCSLNDPVMHWAASGVDGSLHFEEPFWRPYQFILKGCHDLPPIIKPSYKHSSFFAPVGFQPDSLSDKLSISGLIIFHYTKWFLLIPRALFSHQVHNTLTNKPLVNLENRAPPAFLSLHWLEMTELNGLF